MNITSSSSTPLVHPSKCDPNWIIAHFYRTKNPDRVEDVAWLKAEAVQRSEDLSRCLGVLKEKVVWLQVFRWADRRVRMLQLPLSPRLKVDIAPRSGLPSLLTPISLEVATITGRAIYAPLEAVFEILFTTKQDFGSVEGVSALAWETCRKLPPTEQTLLTFFVRVMYSYLVGGEAKQPDWEQHYTREQAKNLQAPLLAFVKSFIPEIPRERLYLDISHLSGGRLPRDRKTGLAQLTVEDLRIVAQAVAHPESWKEIHHHLQDVFEILRYVGVSSKTPKECLMRALRKLPPEDTAALTKFLEHCLDHIQDFEPTWDKWSTPEQLNALQKPIVAYLIRFLTDYWDKFPEAAWPCLLGMDAPTLALNLHPAALKVATVNPCRFMWAVDKFSR